ncbi:gluconate 5-dehydrogenase [Yersinia pseudotuberculosis]|nr:gluconate 5-dehydrogenase [Yersinia pseudotuberculosis]
MDVFTASLRSACSLRCRHFVNNLSLIPEAQPTS